MISFHDNPSLCGIQTWGIAITVALLLLREWMVKEFSMQKNSKDGIYPDWWADSLRNRCSLSHVCNIAYHITCSHFAWQFFFYSASRVIALTISRCDTTDKKSYFVPWAQTALQIILADHPNGLHRQPCSRKRHSKHTLIPLNMKKMKNSLRFVRGFVYITCRYRSVVDHQRS